MQIRYVYKQRLLPVLLLIPIVGLLVISQQIFAQHSPPDTVSAMETLRGRFTAELLGPDIDVDNIEKLIGTIQNDGRWPDINYQDTTRTAFEHSRHLSNMVKLGRAYKKTESPFYEDPVVKQAIDSALNFWLDHDFICENWWWNQIGTPNRIGNLLLIMDDELTRKQTNRAAPIVGRANLGAWGARPGGDLIKIAGIMGKYAIFLRDQQMFDEAIEAIAGEIEFAVDRGDTADVRGLQTDYSFHHRHDRVTSTLTYGRGFANYFADWAYKMRGTKFSFPDTSVELLVDFYLDGISKAMAFAAYPDPGAENRGITRRGALTPYDSEVPEKLLGITSYRQDELETVAQIRKGEREPDLRSSRFFWHTEYYRHQRPDYFASVRIYSSRNHNMEVPYNGEGLKNHHMGDGYNFITRTGEEYIHIFPVWDWQKIPGTTVVQKPSLPDPGEVQQAGLTGFAGGITDGMYGAAAFDFKSPIDPLEAHKSWFFFDEEFVSLGAGIDSDSEYPVATTLNQSLLASDVISGNTSGKITHNRGKHELEKVTWVHHDKTAYLFPDPTDVRLENLQRSGSWYDINKQIWAKKLSGEQKDVFTLWLDHGVSPKQEGYEYIIVPGIEASGVERYRKNSPIQILVNSPKIQAVRHTGLNISQIVFYEAGAVQIAEGLELSVDTPGMVMVKVNGSKVEEITVSDPTRKLKTFRLKITSPVEAETHKNPGEITWNEEEGSTTVHFDLPEGSYAGQSVSLTTLL